MNSPIICSMVINTRKFIPYKFPINTPYFGNALSFLLLHATRKELIESDFSEVVYKVREAVNNMKEEDFINDIHLYQHLANEGVDILHRYWTRWAVSGYGYGQGRFLMDRDMMISNVEKLETHNINLGQGNVSRLRFHFQDDAANLTYLFSSDQQRKELEYYCAMPIENLKFFDEVHITDPNLDWNEINHKYAHQPNFWEKSFPLLRRPVINPKALFSSRKDINVITL